MADSPRLEDKYYDDKDIWLSIFKEDQEAVRKLHSKRQLDGNKGDSGGGGRSLGRDGSDRDHEEEDSKAKGKKC